MRNEPKKRNRLRILSVLVFFYLGLGAISFRTYQLQVLKAEQLSYLAKRQYLKKTTLRAPRGVIYDRNLRELAVNKKSYSIFAHTREIRNPARTIKTLSRILELSPQEIEKKLLDKEPFVWIARQVSEEQGEAIKALKFPGIGAQPDETRYYPVGELLGQVLGFTGIDGQGLEGIERKYDEYLRAKPIYLLVKKDARNEIRMILDEDQKGPEPASLVLTIDQALQYFSEQKLKEAVNKWNAKRGALIAMDPFSGAILALALYPGFNPNYYYAYKPSLFRNWAITDIYEPGSTFKVFALASALEEGKVKLTDTINCENGSYLVGEHTIHDIKKYGELTVPQVLAYSSNIGMAKIAEKLGAELFYKHILQFGFGAKTGVDFPGEQPGLVRNYKKWPPITLRTIGFGQGISVTPLQMITALCAIANGGELIVPYLGEKLIDPEGRERILHRRTVRGKPITKEVAQKITELMVEVVNSGTGTRAQIPGYKVAGKTGTAQKPRPGYLGGGYEPDKWICSFMGFVPADRPKLALLVIIDEPKAEFATGGMIAAPVFQEVAKYALTILGELPELNPPAGLKLALADKIALEKPFEVKEINQTTEINSELNREKMPDLRGMALADALKLSFALGQMPIIQGSGWVIAQEPAPEAQLTGKIILKLSPERE